MAPVGEVLHRRGECCDVLDAGGGGGGHQLAHVLVVRVMVRVRLVVMRVIERHLGAAIPAAASD